MNTRFLTPILLLTIALGCDKGDSKVAAPIPAQQQQPQPPAAAPTKSDRELAAGSWVLERKESLNQERAGPEGYPRIAGLMVRDEKLFLVEAERGENKRISHADWILDQTKNPKEVTFTWYNGFRDDDERPRLAIYELTENVLRICMYTDSYPRGSTKGYEQGRPSSFRADEGTIIYTFKRAEIPASR